MSSSGIPPLPRSVSPASSEDASEKLAPELKPKDNYDFKASTESQPIVAPNICERYWPLLTPSFEQSCKKPSANESLENKTLERIEEFKEEKPIKVVDT